MGSIKLIVKDEMFLHIWALLEKSWKRKLRRRDFLRVWQFSLANLKKILVSIEISWWLIASQFKLCSCRKCLLHSAATSTPSTGFWFLMVIIGRPLKSNRGFIIFVFNQAVWLVLGLFAVVLATNDIVYFISPDMMLIIIMDNYRSAWL